MAPKKKKPEPEPQPEPVVQPQDDEQNVLFLLEAALSCVRSAMRAASGTAHPVQIEFISDAILAVGMAVEGFTDEDEDGHD